MHINWIIKDSGFSFTATCEKCGAVGIKHAFYSKSKRFCSLSCSRSFATSQREGKQSPTGKGDGVTSPLVKNNYYFLKFLFECVVHMYIYIYQWALLSFSHQRSQLLKNWQIKPISSGLWTMCPEPWQREQVNVFWGM